MCLLWVDNTGINVCAYVLDSLTSGYWNDANSGEIKRVEGISEDQLIGTWCPV